MLRRFILLALLAVPGCAEPGELTGRASVLDGDTIEVRGQRVRLWGIDAPESKQTCRDAEGRVYGCGRQAAFALADRIEGRTVRCTPRDTDSYGRVVGTCHLGREDVAGWLVSQGWALDYDQYSHGAYAAQQAEARRNRRGLWQGRFERPWDWRHAAPR